MFKHNTPKNVVISEYIRASEYFLEKAQIGYLNAILDKFSKFIKRLTKQTHYLIKLISLSCLLRIFLAFIAFIK